MFTDIHIKVIPHGCHRYETFGDYWIDERGVLQIRVSRFADPRIARNTAVHEMLEACRCAARGLSFEEIDKFDLAHLDHEDPGCLPDAPYHAEHMQSMEVERLLVSQDGADWSEYYNAAPIPFTGGTAP